MHWPDLTFPPVNLWSAPKQFWMKQMTLTANDIRDRLRLVPETDLLELLDITSEDLVNRFEDKINDRMEYLTEDLETW